MRVAVVIEAPASATVVAVELDIPKGWRARSISDDGAWDKVHHKVKWGPFFEELSRTVTFELAGVADPAILRPYRPTRRVLPNELTGQVSFDGVIQPIWAR